MKKITFSKIIGSTGVFNDGDWVESKDQDPNGEVRLIQLADIGDGIFIDKSNRFLTSEKAKQLKCTYLKEGDVLVARMPDPLGRACIFPKLDKPCVTVVDVCIIRPDSKIANNAYIKFLINSPDFRNKINRFASGTTRQRISRKNLDKISFSLPDYDTQLHIANILSKAESLIVQRKESIRLLDEYLKSVFLEMFGVPANNKTKFSQGTIREIVSEVKYGTSKSSSKSGQYPYLRMNNITTDGYMDFSDLKYIDIEESEKEKYVVKKGDLLFNRTNSKELVGKTGVFSESDEMVIAGYLIRVRTNEKANPWYLWGYLNSLHGKKTLFGMCKAIVGMANINAQELQNIKVLIPPISLQTQFAQIVEKTEALKTQYQQSLQELENLYGSLSQKAFKGELSIKDESLLMAAEPELKYKTS